MQHLGALILKEMHGCDGAASGLPGPAAHPAGRGIIPRHTASCFPLRGAGTATAGATAAAIAIGQQAPPRALGSPDAAPEALQLHDLRVVHKQIDPSAKSFDVPAGAGRVGLAQRT